MKIRMALTALVVIGMFGFAATTADAQCRAKEKAKAGCSAQKAKAGCSADCKKACCPDKVCNHTEAECAKKIRKHYQTRGWLGIEMNLEGNQPAVTRVTNGSPAEAAGFQVGDVLTSLNGIPYGQGNDAVIAEMSKSGFEIGDTVVYTVNRDRQIVTLRTTLARITEPGLARMIEFHHANVKHKPCEKAEKIDK